MSSPDATTPPRARVTGEDTTRVAAQLEQHNRRVLGLGETVEVLHLAIADLSERTNQLIRDPPALEADVAID